MRAQVWHYDGQTAVRYKRELIGDSGGFRLQDKEGDGENYRWVDLLPRDKGGQTIYGLKDRPGWQIGFVDLPSPELAAMLPREARYGGWIDRLGLWRASGVFLAVSTVIVVVVAKAPDFIAPYVPFSWERKLGDAMVGDFGGRICNGPGGQAALDRLVKKIGGDGTLEVHVANIAMVNAVALPGGKIIVFRGLLQEAKSPDELAGVLGHEIGHVKERHVMQALLRQAGLSVLLGGVGGDTGGYMNALVAASYSRDAEAKADAYSIRMLDHAHISPDDTAAFFKRLAEQEKKLGGAAAAFGYVSSHPLSASRERAFRQSKRPGIRYMPVIDGEAWGALVDICHNDPNVSKDDSFF